MAVNDILARPDEDAYVRGEDSLFRMVRCEATVAAPVVPTNMENITSIVVGDPTYRIEYDAIHKGSDDIRKIRRKPAWPVTINVFKGKFDDVLATLRGVTFGTTDVAMPLHASNDLPECIFECVYRDKDLSHVLSYVIQDFILDDTGIDDPLDYSDAVIKGHTYYPPFLVYTGYECVYDRFDATPSTPDYSLSATAATMLTASNHNLWDFDDAAFIKVKDHSAGDEVGNRRRTGVAVTSGTTLAFTTGIPAATDEVSTLYVKAT